MLSLSSLLVVLSLWANSEGPVLLVCLSTYQVLAPLMVKVPLDGLYLALVSMLLGSLPWFGSVKPKQPRISPRAVDKKKKHKHTILIKIKVYWCFWNWMPSCIKMFVTKLWQVLLLLSLCAVSIDWVHDQWRLDAHGWSIPAINSLHFSGD